MARACLILALIAAPLGAADVLFTSGPFQVYSRAGDKAGRETLNRLEQFRHVFGTTLGKSDLQAIWPIRITVAKPLKGLPDRITLNKDVYEGTLDTTGAVPRAFWKDLAKIFLDANAGPMPKPIDRGLLDLFSTLEIAGARVTLGTPPPPADRTRDWARMHLLSVHPDYSGRLRVLLSNLQKGIDPYPAFKNAFEKTPDEIEKQLDGYMQAGQYGTTMLAGRPLAASDFYARPAPASTDTKSAADLLASGDLAGAAKANPRWGEPFYQMAMATSDPDKRVEYMKKAIAAEPRNPKYSDALAKAISQNKLAIEQAKQKAIEDERRHVEQLRDDAMRRVREAEMKANEGKAPVDSAKVQEWWDGPKAEGKVNGALLRVDCTGGKARLAIQPHGGKIVQLLVRDPGQIVLRGGGVTTLGCGVQKPARNVTVEYFPKPDAKLGTAGDAAVVEFH